MSEFAEFRCFKRQAPASHAYQSDWYHDWRTKFEGNQVPLSMEHRQALGRLIPLLLCGEQSANLVFSEEVQRLDNGEHPEQIDSLKQIEADEFYHDQALQGVLAQMPQAEDINQIRRRAQVFYAALGRSDSLAQHFAQLCHLDTCVTIIMSEMAQSKLGREHVVSELFEHIRHDEARHVRICGEHLRFLGGHKQAFRTEAQFIKRKLVALLNSELMAFNALAVNWKRMFERILK